LLLELLKKNQEPKKQEPKNKGKRNPRIKEKLQKNKKAKSVTMNKSLILILSAILLMAACNLPSANKTPSATNKKNDSAVIKMGDEKDNGTANVTPVMDMDLLNEASDAILNLPEIKRLAINISKQSHRKNILKAWGFGIGTQGTKTYVLVHVAEDNGSSLVSRCMFYYYPNDKTILNIDTDSDSTLTLAEWRKTKVTW